MKKTTNFFVVLLALANFMWLTTPHACTNITLKAKDNTVMVARTLEFGPPLNSNVMTTPQKSTFQSPAPNDGKGLNWQSKYGYVFLDFFGLQHPVDGMNEKGLSIGALYLPGYTEYQNVPQGKEAQALHYFYLGDWILGNFSTVDEVKQAIQDVYVFATPVNAGGYENQIFPLHLVITDASGQSITVEFVKGKMELSDNPLGLLTNSPTFTWQMNNLKNYTNLSPYSEDPIKIDGLLYTGTGQGSGAVGLPGDYSPPSRFVKMFFLTQSAEQTENAISALNSAEHIINNVDIAKGTVRPSKGEGSGQDIDRTQWTVFKDLKNLKLYFKSYENTTLQSIDLNKVNLSPGAKPLSMPVTSQQITVDVTDRFKERHPLHNDEQQKQ